jgi:hypothetical protein
MPNPVANPQLRWSKLIGHDHENARHTFHRPMELQTANGYIPIQNKPSGPQQFNNRRQAPPTDSGPSNSQDVRFMDGITEPHDDESISFQMGVGDEQGQ